MIKVRALALAAGGLTIAAVALAAVGHIPTRYAGSFPSDGLRKDITGTFTGKALNLKWSVLAKGTPVRRAFAGSCANTSPTTTRCAGQIDGSTPAEAVVTWNSGKPVALAISK